MIINRCIIVFLSIVILLNSFSLFLPSSMAVSEKDDCSIGDINNDGALNVKDLVKLKKFIAEKNDITDLQLDVNGDGMCSAEDIICMRTVILYGKENLKIHTVVFIDKYGQILDIQKVKHSFSAVAPTSPVIGGYKFVGWSENFANVMKDMRIFAQYEVDYVVENITGSVIDLSDVVIDTTVNVSAQEGTAKVLAVGKNLFAENAVETSFHNTVILPTVLPAGVYRFGAEIELGVGNTNTTCLVGIKSGTTTLTNVALKVSNETKLRNSVYINASQPFDRITLYAGSNASTAKGQTATFKNIHLEFGNGTAEYEPYCGALYDINFNHKIVAKSCPLYLLSCDQSILDVTYCKLKKSIPVPNLYYFENNYLLNKVNKINELIGSSSNTDAFIFITDQHLEKNQNAGQAPSLIKYISDNTKVNKIFLGGDIRAGVPDKEYAGMIKEAVSGQSHYIMGNHEYDLATTDTDLCYAYDINKPEQIGNTARHYYYVDNTQQKIRYVVLNGFMSNNGTSASADDIATQVQWLKDEALNVESGWGIVLFAHEFFARDWSSTNNHRYVLSSAKPIQSAIDEYSGNGEIIAVLHGHIHQDMINYTKEGIPCIGVTCDKYTSAIPMTGEFLVARAKGTITEQAFDVVIVDRTERKIHCVRIGAPALDKTGWTDEEQVEIRTVDFK